MKKFVFTPISLSGLIILTALAVVLAGPGVIQNDLIAFSLTIAFLFTFSFCGILALISFLRSKNKLKLNSYFKWPAEFLSSQETHKLIHEIYGINLLPLIRLKIKFNWDDSRLQTCDHLILGSFANQIVLEEEITFLNRGIYKCQNIECTIEDLTRFWCFRWTINVNINAKVLPPAKESTSIPLLNSVFSAGDSIPIGNDRVGDYYDLKTYQPQDGVSKIAWKILARSNELITRQPEQEVKPEGKVCIYCLALEPDDLICSELIAYLKLLESEKIKIILGAEGSSKHCYTFLDSLDLLVEAARSAQKVNLENFKNFLSQISESFSKRIIIFVGNQAGRSLSVSMLSQITSELGYEIIITSQEPTEKQNAPKLAPKLFSNLILEANKKAEQEMPSLDFIKDCQNNNLEILTFKNGRV